MAKKTLEIRKNSDGTLTIKSGSYIENFEIRAKTGREQFEAGRWAILTGGNVFTEKTEKMLREVLDFWD